MYTLYDFNALCCEEKLSLTWAEGQFLDFRIAGKKKVMLYQLFSFYVELSYNPKLNQVTFARSFSNPDILEPYLSKINISKVIHG